MSDKPSINAANLNDFQAGGWLEDMAKAAREISSGGVIGSTVTPLRTIADGLRDALSNTSRKITYLESVKIARPEGLTTVALEDLKLLREIEKATRDSLHSIESFLEQCRKSHDRYWCQRMIIDDQESSALEMVEFDSGLKSSGEHPHKACE
ncbi:hypothetical protein JEQ07_24000 [Serratia proteamaculans]|uniref:Uncharacterized protein n=1 Tax=Serratia proteamaculans TaxID=28151 RepID=A0ABS0TYJ2_SERPR|nr:hypothetical protein [Serratia proteamaculans]MBI6183445.1 hypothetical protein [Serratia proteamaculans]